MSSTEPTPRPAPTTPPPVSLAFAEVLEHRRALDAQKRPKPAPAASDASRDAIATLRLTDDAARRDEDRRRRIDEINRQERAAEQAQADARWAKRAEMLDGFPPRAVADLAQWEPQTLACPKFAALKQAMDLGALMGMRGPHGTKKTTAACALARVYIREQRALAVYAKADDYLATFRVRTQGYGARITQADWISERTRRDGFLVLDELDKVPGLYGDNHTRRQTECWLQAILDWRYAARNRPTLLIGNFDQATWDVVVPESIRDRFGPKCHGVIRNYGGPSMRGDA
jgi:hypothetical protein